MFKNFDKVIEYSTRFIFSFVFITISLNCNGPFAHAIGDEEICTFIPHRNIDAVLRSPHFYESIGFVVELILQQCPKESCTLIGIGGSPTPFLAYFDSKIPGYATNIPLSVKTDEVELDEKLFQHIDRYFPKIDEKIKKVVIFDYMYKGVSAKRLTRIFKQYLSVKWNHVSFESLLITARHNEDNGPLDAFTISASSDNLIISLLHDTKLKQIYRPYRKFIPGQEDEAGSLNPKYNELVQKMRDYFNSEEHEFPEWLKSEFRLLSETEMNARLLRKIRLTHEME